MKIVVAIIVYNRLQNIKHWFDCWEKCDHYGAELVVIHNWDGNEKNEFSELCEENNIRYVKRPNIGFDVGAYQDVCKGRLNGFPEWDRLLWVVDDCLPMHFDFIEQFDKAMKKGVGVACMCVSPYAGKHIRTTGYMIDRETAAKLYFPADPITTKNDCYLFEHKGKRNTFYNQVTRMGLEVRMVADNKVSPLWDSGYHRRVDRQKEHEKTFGDVNREDKILFLCPIYKSYPQIISSLLLQTHKNWVLMLIHDGPDTDNIQRFIPDDDRIAFMETPKHGGFWGHYIRQVGLEIFSDMADFLIVTNPDNYYVPTALEYMLKGFGERDSSIAVYCAQNVHSYKAWQVLDCKLAKGYLDCGGVMFKSIVAKEVPWTEITDHSADWIWFEDIIKKYGAQRFHKVKGCLFIHN